MCVCLCVCVCGGGGGVKGGGSWVIWFIITLLFAKPFLRQSCTAGSDSFRELPVTHVLIRSENNCLYRWF